MPKVYKSECKNCSEPSTSTAAESFLCGFLTVTELFTNISKPRLPSPIVLFIPEVFRGWLKADPCCAGLCTEKATVTATAFLALLSYSSAEMQFEM